MQSLTAHVLRFEAEVETPLRLPVLKGSALRGALFHALRRHFCISQGACRGSVTCSLPDLCPAGMLFAPRDDAGARGVDAPRPFVLEPPLDSRTEYGPGDRLAFSLTTFGRALNQFPHTLIAINEMGQAGVGAVSHRGGAADGGGAGSGTLGQPGGNGRSRRDRGDLERGRFRLREVWASHPLEGKEERIFWDRNPVVRVPRLPVTHADVLEAVGRLGEPTRLSLRFRTPLRLVERGRFVGPEDFGFRTLFLRLQERLGALARFYCGGDSSLAIGELLSLAESVTIAERALEWVEVERFSRRHGQRLSMGGLLGRVTFVGPLAPFLPYLVWGEISHVGKYAVFGHGRYEVMSHE